MLLGRAVRPLRRCGSQLYSVARTDGRLFCWDARSTGEALYALDVPGVRTNQRIAFDLEPTGRHLVIGGTTGAASVFDLQTGLLRTQMTLAPDTLAAVSAHPFLPLIATASGHRRFRDSDEDEWDGGGSLTPRTAATANALSVWTVSTQQR